VKELTENLIHFCLGENMPVVVASIRRLSKGQDKEEVTKEM
jgi:hypothetical protein